MTKIVALGVQAPRSRRTVSGTSDTPGAADLEGIVRFTSSSAVAVTLDHTGLMDGYCVDLIGAGTGVVTISSSDTMLPAGPLVLRTSGSAATATWNATASTWDVVGDLAKGANRVIGSTAVNATFGASIGFDYTLFCTGAGGIAITLPTAVGNLSEYSVKNNTSGIVTMNTTSSQTIDGSASGVITLSPGQALKFQSDTANWGIF